MINLTVSKAKPITNNLRIEDEDLTITVMDDDELTARRMQRDAEAIVKALHESLPQGTWNRLVSAIARQWASDTEGIISAHRWYAVDSEG